MKILLSGLNGHMGAELVKLAAAGVRGAEVVAGVDPFGYEDSAIPCAPDFDSACADADCVVDFSHHSSTAALTAFAVKNRLPLIIATTGQTEEERQMIDDAAKEIPVFFAANFSMGVALLIELAKKAAAAMPEAEIEIVETHHNRKVDAPSGTAIAIAEAVKTVRPGANIVCGRSGFGKREPDDIGISSIRMGNVVGIHEVIVGTQNQTITLKHEAHSRALFAEGALAAADFLIGKPAGMYDMTSILE